MNERKVTVARAGIRKSLALTDAKAIIEDRSYEVNLRRITPWSVSFLLNGTVFHVSCIRVTRLPSGEADVEVLINGTYVKYRISDHRAELLKSMLKTLPGSTGDFEIRAPMPGLVSRIECAPGNSVEPGTGILILEAMKMENEIRASSRGTVKEIRVRQGQNVEKNEVLAVLETT
ncbi:MAG: biotin/lipoyl-binding protein [Ignavibacterium sp.]